MKTKTIFLGVNNSKYSSYIHGIKSLEKISEVIVFNYREINLRYGKEEMNKRFLELIEKEKPDFVFVWSLTDDFDIDTLLRIKEFSPLTISMMFFGDDDSHYDSYTRYYKLLFDYSIACQKEYAEKYIEEDFKDRVYFVNAINLDNFYPMKLEKKFDVTFIGLKQLDRYNYLKYLIDNGVNVTIFGQGWENTDLKEYHKGFLSLEDYNKVLNQSKIVLNFSKSILGKSHYKGRFYETASSKAFQLMEKNNILKGIMFENKEDLLKKINYYLKNEKLRNENSNKLYKQVKKIKPFSEEMRYIFNDVKKKNLVYNLNKQFSTIQII